MRTSVKPRKVLNFVVPADAASKYGQCTRSPSFLSASAHPLYIDTCILNNCLLLLVSVLPYHPFIYCELSTLCRCWAKHVGLPHVAVVWACSLHGRAASQRIATQVEPVGSVHAWVGRRQGHRCVCFLRFGSLAENRFPVVWYIHVSCCVTALNHTYTEGLLQLPSLSVYDISLISIVCR